MSIGKNIARRRKLIGLTQEELGGRLGITNQAVSKWESEVSMPDIMLLPQIADVLGCTLEEIMDGCNLTEAETSAALRLMCDVHINEAYTDHKTKEIKYVFRISNAAYALAIYKLAGLHS